MKYLILFLAFFIFSCGNNYYYESEKEFSEKEIWTFTDAFEAEFTIKASAPFDVYFELDHGDDYIFENIYLRITDDFKGKSETEIVNLNISDKNGLWKGKKSGNHYSYKTLLRKAFTFQKPGKHLIKIEQFTRTDSLEGISKVRFYLEVIIK